MERGEPCIPNLAVLVLVPAADSVSLLTMGKYKNRESDDIERSHTMPTYAPDYSFSFNEATALPPSSLQS